MPSAGARRSILAARASMTSRVASAAVTVASAKARSSERRPELCFRSNSMTPRQRRPLRSATSRSCNETSDRAARTDLRANSCLARTSADCRLEDLALQCLDPSTLTPAKTRSRSDFALSTCARPRPLPKARITQNRQGSSRWTVCPGFTMDLARAFQACLTEANDPAPTGAGSHHRARSLASPPVPRGNVG